MKAIEFASKIKIKRAWHKIQKQEHYDFLVKLVNWKSQVWIDKLNSNIKAMDCCFNCLSANISKEAFTPNHLKALKIFGGFEIIKAVRVIQNEAPEKMQFIPTKDGIDFKIDSAELEYRLPNQTWVSIDKKVVYKAFSYIVEEYINNYVRVEFKKMTITKDGWVWKYAYR